MLSRVKSLGLGLAFSSLVGAALLPSACGSSRGIAAQADAEIPGPIADRLSACAEERKTHFEPTRHAISFEIEFDEDGQVDEVQLKDSTLEDQGLEACMVSVLRSLTVDDLPVRMSGNGSLDGMGPESRGLMGQEQVLLCFASPPVCVWDADWRIVLDGADLCEYGAVELDREAVGGTDGDGHSKACPGGKAS